METKNKFAVLAIGTEVTSGQIVNKNTALMSSWMEALGFEPILHIAVPDDHDLMMEGLKKCTEKAEFVFTCGGLGPTTDDFTRHVISDFLGRELVFDQDSLDKILEKMKSMGRTFMESQRQQCFFPKGANILWNSAGTANGFFLDAKTFKLAVLPGPPNEVTAIWKDGLEKIIEGYVSSGRKPVLRRWNCMGRPEAELAEIVEAVIKGSKLKTGYRLNAPYVEIKLWCEPGDLSSQTKYFDEIESRLGEWIVLRGDEDPWEDFWGLIAKLKSVAIVDEASEGILGARLSERLRKEVSREGLPRLVNVTGSLKPHLSADLEIHVHPMNPKGEFKLALKNEGKAKQFELRSPFHHSLANDRSRLAAAELTILSANQFLTGK